MIDNLHIKCLKCGVELTRDSGYTCGCEYPVKISRTELTDDEKFTPDGLPIIQPIKRQWPTPAPAPDGAVAVCGVCGLRIMRVMGYVCTRGDCPTGMGPVMCGGAT